MGKNGLKITLGLLGILLVSGCTVELPELPGKQAELPEIDGYAAGIFSLGPSTAPYFTKEETWADPDVVGVYIRLPWESAHIAPGSSADSFDFTTLDHELNQAAKYGKFVSLSFSAGKDDIPDWLFDEGGVQAYQFQDGGSQLEEGKCGARMTLGNPTDELYQKHYFDLIRGVGEHIASNPDWYNSLAYYKISGANLYTHEFRLPNRCEEGCICNTQVWAEAGYTPEGMYDFVLNQMAVIQEVYPGKPMMFQLIQDGLPWINDQGDYLKADGTSSGAPVTRSVEQVEEIIRRASEVYGPLFVVAHNGLGFERKPNRWVVEAGKNGQPTAFQTRNLTDLQTPEQLQQTLENLWDNSNAFYLEVYEQVLEVARDKENVLVPDDQAEINTISEWNKQLQSRAQ